MATRVEITIQVKQASNPDFSFLNVSHPLYPFYRHILGLMQMGVYGYADNASGDEEEVEAAHAPNTPDGEENPTPIAAAASTPSTANDEQQMSPQKPAATPPRPLPTPLPRESVPVPPNFKIPTDSNLRNITDSTARSVARCGNAGSQLEFKLRLEKAANHLYQFLTPSNQFHDYYVFVRNCLRDGKIPVVPESNDNSKDDDEIKTEKRRKLQLFLAKKRSKPAPPSPPPPPALQ
ncbi:hypothetical protein EV182_001079 [Spiromyces aspiralis]|uniref:Uncharacterized protein n=1 Tax=Spiromyces aspiralis TaxID=68401 RepID=A0ACC1HNM3_9FUNG|nr:hypothetical protein EV182_001079 [Spiromyces aspiralis]